jgi:hypothetical protein
MKNAVFWDVTPCGSCKNRQFGGRIASIIRVTRIGDLGTTLKNGVFWFKPHGVTTQKTPFFIVTAVKISNLT